MALRKTIQVEGNSFIESSYGNIKNGTKNIEFVSYIKVSCISGNKNKLLASINFSGENHNFNKDYKISVSVSENSHNFIAQTYEQLKLMPEFLDAVDC